MSEREQPPDRATLERVRREFVDAQRHLETAAGQLQDVLREVELAARTGRTHIEEGGAAAELPLVAELGPLRAELADRLTAFDRARLATRVTNMRLAVWEGASLSEIARRYGVTRQYVSKLLKEHPG